MTQSQRVDVCVVGGGIIGLAATRALVANTPGLKVVLVEKESTVGVHQTGHNSGVLHSGLYYKPGSLKARLCVSGQRKMVAFCEDEGIEFRRSGKLVVATAEDELPALAELRSRGLANGLVGLKTLTPEEFQEIEPSVTGLAALHVPEAGVVDYPAVARRLADRLIDGGVDLRLGAPVTAIRRGAGTTEIEIGEDEVVRSSMVLNCAGLHADRVAAMAGVESDIRIVPFRGEYYTMTPDSAGLVRALVYPVPDPRFPFLGVHFTRKVDGSVEVGPNAVLALGREHYRGARPVPADIIETVTYPGFLRLVSRYWRTGAAEAWRSMWRSTYARSARRLIPEVRTGHLIPGGAGVRAQAVTRDGKLLDDFSIVETAGGVHVLNAPSPGATASLAIGEHIASIVARGLTG